MIKNLGFRLAGAVFVTAVEAVDCGIAFVSGGIDVSGFVAIYCATTCATAA